MNEAEERQFKIERAGNYLAERAELLTRACDANLRGVVIWEAVEYYRKELHRAIDDWNMVVAHV